MLLPRGRILTPPPERRIHPAGRRAALGLPDESGVPIGIAACHGGGVRMRPPKPSLIRPPTALNESDRSGETTWPSATLREPPALPPKTRRTHNPSLVGRLKQFALLPMLWASRRSPCPGFGVALMSH